jgi:transcriptional regulator with XRE-family HTH domain
MSINNKLRAFREAQNMTQEELGNILGLKRASISAIETGKMELTLDNLLKIADHFSLSIDHFLERKVSDTIHVSTTTVLPADSKQIIPVVVDSQNNPVIKMLPHAAQAGYLQDRADPEFWETLPEVSLPERRFKNGHYVGIQVWGESMQNTFNGGDWIICQNVQSIQHILYGEIYVVICEGMMPVVKRIERLKNEQKLLLVSDNSSHEPYEIEKNDIIELWRYDTLIRFQPFTLKKGC